MKSDIRERMHELMNHLNELLDVKVKDEEIRQLYNEYQEKKGASEDRLAAFETEMDVRLPEDFREFYKCKDGSGYAFHILYPGDAEREECTPFYMMSLDEIRETKQYFCERDEKLSEYYSAEEISKLDPEIKPYLFHKPWIPFATMAGGSLYLMLDFDPSEQGSYGQIIIYVHDPDFVYFITDTFTNLLKDSNRNLEIMDEIEY
ncbi:MULTISPECIES: SMI1/KNR4 family protein [Paenibacillus]|uniref:Cell wall assembly-cell proliferation coordinating protein KNR4-like protein n=1 Tax=Paenibacillus illinoisensis TaxID=59845 RepID=A0A2W0CF43_9BACL|nr:SMI1/KNR4 family protein [Paenibacillus illinoisensis]PYY28672.1 Cell wall assembly-cell proliferation coordinating protein KNR4-like protein [Paenibacillus illinoisensis]